MTNQALIETKYTKCIPEGAGHPEIALGSQAGGKKVSNLALLIILACVLYFTALGSFPFLDPSEAYYSEAAREMIESGDYITPHLNYQIYFSKPIMTFWLIAGSYKLLGIGEMASRLPFALLTTFLGLFIYFSVQKLFNARAAFAASFCLLTSPLILFYSRKSPIDAAFTAFLGISVLSTALCISGRSKNSWWMASTALALATLTKGPAALILYFAALSLYFLIVLPTLLRKNSSGNFNLVPEIIRVLSSLKPLPFMLLFLLLVLPWHIAVWNETKGLFLKVFFLYENFARFKGLTNLQNTPFWFYIPVLLYGFFPWVLLAPIYASRFFSVKSIDKNAMKEAYLSSLASDKSALLYLLAFALSTSLIFTLSSTKLATYILPVLVPLSVMAGVFIDQLLSDERRAVISSKAIRLASGLYLLSTIAIMLAIGTWSLAWKEDDPALLRLSLFLLSMVLVAGALFAFRRTRNVNELNGLKSAAISISTSLALFLSLAVPAAFFVFGNFMQEDLKALSIKAGRLTERIAMYNTFAPSSMFYSTRPVDTFFHPHQIVKVEKASIPGSVQCILVREKDLPSLVAGYTGKLELLAEEDDWRLYQTPGYEVDSVKTLEEIFSDNKTFEMIINGKSPAGPMVVPYADGELYMKIIRRRANKISNASQ